MKSIFKKRLNRIIHTIYTPYTCSYEYYRFEKTEETSIIISVGELINPNEKFYECDLNYILLLGDTIELNLPTGKEIFTIDRREFNDINDNIVYHVKEEEWIKDELTERSKQKAEELQKLKDEFNTKQKLKIEEFNNRKWWEFWKELE